MEENEMMPSAAAAETPKPLVIDATAKMFLYETAKWGKFLAIVGFVFCGLIVLASLAIMVFGSTLSSVGMRGSGSAIASFGFGFLGFIYLLFGLLYYFPSKYLYDFAIYIKQAITIDDQESLNYAFQKLKSLYKFWGILMIVVIGFYALALVFAVIVGGFAASQLQGV